MIRPLRLETNWEQTWNINIGCLLMFMKVGCTQIFLVLLKEHSSSAFLLEFLQTGFLIKALSMPIVSNWRLECHHCHKPRAGWAHLVSDKRLLTLIAGQCNCSTHATCKARGWIVRISSALSHSTLARLTWREKHIYHLWCSECYPAGCYLLQFC